MFEAADRVSVESSDSFTAGQAIALNHYVENAQSTPKDFNPWLAVTTASQEAPELSDPAYSRTEI